MKFPGDQLVHRLSQVSHIIIKVGTGILTPHIDSPENYFSILANEVAAIIKTGRKAIIVTSGAVGYGRRMYSAGGDDIVSRQALASLGRVRSRPGRSRHRRNCQPRRWPTVARRFPC
ncbi:MAG: hypothetical protein KDK38_04875 [Leptospiraceae bacterium]|nr:hypothetical protein [Leptospiraceae bacterium]